MLPPSFWKAKFGLAQPFEAYVASGTPPQQQNWRRFERVARERAALHSRQRAMLADFTRATGILALSGTWCGDCVQQMPLLAIITENRPDLFDFRLLDRDANPDLAEPLTICGGRRVPVVVFLNEDFEFVSLLGDQTLSRYRVRAVRELGPACALPGADPPADEIAATLQDWLNEVERVQLLLRMSPRLRERHGD